MEKSNKITIYVIIFIIVLFACVYGYITLSNKQPQPQQPITDNQQNKQQIITNKGSYTPILKAKDNSNITSVYIDFGYGEQFLMDVDNVYKEHYHSSQFLNDTLYVIKRIGYNGNENGDWTDELWKYDLNGNGTKIYSARGLDFRALDNGKIAITDGPYLRIIDSNGLPLKEFSFEDISIDPENINIYPILPSSISSQGEYVILENILPGQIAGLVKINTDTGEITKYDLQNLKIGADFEVSPNLDKIAFSTYKMLFDANSEAEYKNNKEKVDLIIYNLNTKEQKTILSRTSSDGPFTIRWIDENTIEYNVPATDTQKETRNKINIQ
ncbi:MAG TPA: hypothetical protein PKJ54_03305 [Candidatus Pacearchaeota archaeon]|nr:hypothetical protein [Candidatus Pacearchaeota archaeon]